MTTGVDAPVLFDCRDAFASAVQELAEEDERVVIVCSDSVGSSKLVGFKNRYPDRLINVGIAEQAMVGVAAGLANAGRLPIVSAASSFVTARALEQIKVDLAYTNANVVVCGMSPGVAYGELGPTHHSIEDIAWLRVIDTLAVIVPADPRETGLAIRAAVQHSGPAFVRVSRIGVPDIYDNSYQFRWGKAARLRAGADLTVITNGTLLCRALVAADMLSARGISCRVVSMPTVKPLDVDEIVSAAEETGAILTVEEHCAHGGLGSAVAEVVVSSQPVPMRILGFPGFLPTGSATWLLEHFGLTAEGISRAAVELVNRKHA
jgi:transketolase